MENENKHIPEHLLQRWQEVSKRIGEASVAVVIANQEYHDAIAERIALSAELKEWQMKMLFGIDWKP